MDITSTQTIAVICTIVDFKVESFSCVFHEKVVAGLQSHRVMTSVVIWFQGSKIVIHSETPQNSVNEINLNKDEDVRSREMRGRGRCEVEGDVRSREM